MKLGSDIINKIKPCIPYDDNLTLLSSFTINEFKKALFEMDSNKSPRPDDINLAFYKRYWDLCGLEIF